jgi:hypothetical protein
LRSTLINELKPSLLDFNRISCSKEMIRQRFTAICREALRADEAAQHSDCRVLEPHFRQLIELATAEDDNRELKDCFCSIIRGEIAAPYETLAYCMRALRYEELAEASRQRLGDPPDPRWMNTHSDLLHALRDETWEDAEMWTHQS